MELNEYGRELILFCQPVDTAMVVVSSTIVQFYCHQTVYSRCNARAIPSIGKEGTPESLEEKSRD